METLYELETFKVHLAVAEPDLKPCRSSEEVAAICRPIYADLDADQEHFAVLLLNNKNRVRGFKVVTSGSLTATLVHPREVFRAVVLYGAAAVVFAHNHPSGDPYPSPEDIDLTKRLRGVGELLGVRVLDHIVLGRASYFSFNDRGMMDGFVCDPFKLEPKPATPAAPALRPDGRKRRSDFGRPRGQYKKRKDIGIPRGPRSKPAESPTTAAGDNPQS